MYDIEPLKVPEEVKTYLDSIGLPVELLDVYYIFEMGARKYARGDWLTRPSAFEGDTRFPSGIRHKVKYYYGHSAYDHESKFCHLLHDIVNSVMQYTVDKRAGKVKLKCDEVQNDQ